MAIRLLVLWGISLGLLAGCGPEVQEVKPASGDLPQDVPPINLSETDWPWWRGSSRIGIAGDQRIPTEWGTTTHVLWKSEIPGRGHASPTVVGDGIYLATADEDQQTQSVRLMTARRGRNSGRR